MNRLFVITFAIALVVTAVVTYIWKGTVNWETAFRFAVILGITLPIINALTRKRK